MTPPSDDRCRCTCICAYRCAYRCSYISSYGCACSKSIPRPGWRLLALAGCLMSTARIEMTHPARLSIDITVDDADWDWLSRALLSASPDQGGPVPSAAPYAYASRHPGVATCALWPEPRSVRAARIFTQSTLREWLMHDLVHDVAVTASELVTNACRYGLEHGAGFTYDRSIRLGLLRHGTHVLCAVADPGHDAPVLNRFPDDGETELAEGGRGLQVIACLSEAWGWTTLERAGKVVWAVFAVPHLKSVPGAG
ncbi:MAG: hypothetical protein GEV11_12105 [Streptosporangiales bacterium]|nr:hypothetical protein [Streptosporangiales bacterium]